MMYLGQTQYKTIASQEIYYLVALVMLLLLIFKSDVHVDTVIYLNGAVFGFIFAILLPVVIHLRWLLGQYRREEYLKLEPTGYEVGFVGVSCQIQPHSNKRTLLS